MAAAAAALPLAAVSGCRGIGVLGTPPPPPADVTVLQAAITAENLMVQRYRAVLNGAAGSAAALGPLLRPLLAEHVAHLAQLRSRLVVPTGSAASVSPSPPGGKRPSAPAVPTAPAAAVAFLRTAEQAAAIAMLNRVPRAPASLAQLFASISASEATHVPPLSTGVTAVGGAAAPSGQWVAR
jgi:hypothetical protein